MTRRTLERSTTYRELHQHFEHHPALVGHRNGGRHTVYRGPRGSVAVPHNHGGAVPNGTLRSIIRMALLAGLGALTALALALVL